MSRRRRERVGARAQLRRRGRGPAVHRRSRRYGPRVERGRRRLRADVRRDDGGPLVVGERAGDGALLVGRRRASLRQFRPNRQGVGAGRPRGVGPRSMRVARGAPRGLRDAPRRAHRAGRDAVRVGGARGDQVYLWDIEAVARPAASAPRDDAALVRAMEGQTDRRMRSPWTRRGRRSCPGARGDGSGVGRAGFFRAGETSRALGKRAMRGDGSHGKIVHHGVERRDDPPVGRRPAAVRADHGQRPPPRRRGVERRDGRELARGVQRWRGWTRPRHGRREATNRAALPRTRGGD